MSIAVTKTKTKQWRQEERAIKDYLQLIYAEVCGFSDASVDHHDNYTYGETTWTGVSKIIEHLSLNERDIFYDFGSGVGKVTTQFFANSPVREAYGVELGEMRYRDSVASLKTFKKDLPLLFADKARKIKFINDSFLNVDLSKATVLYACSTCFSDTLLRKMAIMANKAPKLRYVISLSELPNLRMTYEQKIHIRCTWERANECYIYSN